MTLTCLGWAAARRAGWHFSSGLLLAAGCVLKLAPVVLIPYLLVRKDWRGLAVRYDKKPESYQAGLELCAGLLWIRHLGSQP